MKDTVKETQDMIGVQVTGGDHQIEAQGGQVEKSQEKGHIQHQGLQETKGTSIMVVVVSTSTVTNISINTDMTDNKTITTKLSIK